MTRNEAKLILLRSRIQGVNDEDFEQAFDMAIQALDDKGQIKELCEWVWERISEEKWRVIPQCKGDTVLFESYRLFTYCPYCGRKIMERIL